MTWHIADDQRLWEDGLLLCCRDWHTSVDSMWNNVSGWEIRAQGRRKERTRKTGEKGNLWLNQLYSSPVSKIVFLLRQPRDHDCKCNYKYDEKLIIIVHNKKWQRDRQTDRQTDRQALGDQWSLRCFSAPRRATADSDWISADRFVWRHVLFAPRLTATSLSVSLSLLLLYCLPLSLYICLSCLCVCTWRVCPGTFRFTGHPFSCRSFSPSPSLYLSICFSVPLSVRFFVRSSEWRCMTTLIRSTNVTTDQC